FCVNVVKSPLMRVSAAGGTATVLRSPDDDKDSEGMRYPWFLPDGNHYLYTLSRFGDMPVRVGSLDKSGKPDKVIAQAHSNVIYAQGRLLYLREHTLMAQPFDPERLAIMGEPAPVAEGIPVFLQPSRDAGFTASAGGLLAYQSGVEGGQYRLIWKDREGR